MNPVDRPGGTSGAAGAEPSGDADELRRALDRQIDIGRRAAAEIRRLEGALAEARERQRASRDELNALRRRLPVRIALGLGRRIRPIVEGTRAVRSRLSGRQTGGGSGGGQRSTPGPRSTPAAGDGPADEHAERAFLAALTTQLGGPAPTTGPFVSIVMLNRDGSADLRRCLPALAATAYRDVELIVVDNASSDDSLAVLRAFRPPFPVRIIENPVNESFSAANNRAVATSAGELVLFLNNDIEPIGIHWLGHLVDGLADPSVVAVGARLIYPRRTSTARAGLRFADLSLQHGGVGFRIDDGVALPEPLGAGSDALSDWAAAVRDVPALTAACLLVRRSAFDAVDGFDPGYDYGLEDVDLCLRLGDAGGGLRYDGRAALWHHESTSRVRDERAIRLARSEANRERFVSTWGPRLFRTVQRDALRAAGRGDVASGGVGIRWRAAPWHIATIGAPGEAPDSPPAGVDVAVALDPRVDIRRWPPGPIRVARIGRDAAGAAWLRAPWFDDFDLVVVADDALADELAATGVPRPTVLGADEAPDGPAFGAALDAWLAVRRIGIRIGIPSWDVAAAWGDLHVARDLQRALRRRGWQVRIQLRPEWTGGAAARDDVTIHVLGAAEAPTRSGQLNVLWHLSHPDGATPELYERYDLAFVASTSFAAEMASRTRVPVAALHQATDPERFRPGLPGPAHELLFVANSRGVRRHILDELLPTNHEIAVYGKAWTPERLDPRHLAGEHIPNDELAGTYAAAAIVLNDHWLDMQREGFLSNRLYDAAAAGAFVISDDVEGLGGEFDGGIVGYVGAAELRALVDHFLAHPDERRAHADRARAAVLDRHTFDHRAATLVDAIEPALAARPAEIAARGAGGR